MRVMRDEPKRGFDQLLVKALMNATGVFPIGTLAIVGIYGVLAYVVWLRTPEIGVRMALGASPSQVWQAVVSRAVDTTLPNMIAGPTRDPLLDRARRTEARGFAGVSSLDRLVYRARSRSSH